MIILLLCLLVCLPLKLYLFQNNESTKFRLNYTSKLFPVLQLHARPKALSKSDRHNNLQVWLF